MPFEKLMQSVAALSDEELALPMGKLAERWGEPADRVADAIDAVRVAYGEDMYIVLPPPGFPGTRRLSRAPHPARMQR